MGICTSKLRSLPLIAAAVLAAWSGSWAQGRAVGGFAPKHTHGRVVSAADDYEMTAGKLSADRSSAGFRERFSFSAEVGNAGGGKFPGGQIGAALVDEKSAVVEVVGVENHFVAIRPGERVRVNISCSLSDGVAAPGRSYRLTVVVRAKGGEWESVSASGGGVPSVGFTVASRRPAPAAASPAAVAPVATAAPAAPPAATAPAATAPAATAPAAPPAATAPAAAAPAAGDWDLRKLDTARDAGYMSAIEKDVVLEMNKVRSDPRRYAELYIAPLLQNKGGADADVRECIDELSKMQSAGPLKPEKGLYLAAKDHADDQSRTGATGHDGSDGSDFTDRILRYCERGGGGSAAAENINYGKTDGRGIVAALLIDAGTPSRGHRKNIMNGRYTQTGVAVGTHKTYGALCVIDYAQNYVTKSHY